MHSDLVIAYRIEAAFIRAKIAKAEAIIQRIEESGEPEFDEPIRSILMACYGTVQYLTGVIEPMEEVIAKMETFTPTQWAAGLVDARDSIRAAKAKFPNIFKKEEK